VLCSDIFFWFSLCFSDRRLTDEFINGMFYLMAGAVIAAM
jgi:hypothetical protein